MNNEREYFFKKGNKYGIKGRPKKERYCSDMLDKLGKKPIPKELEKIFKNIPSISNSTTRLEALMESVYIRALKGDKWAIEFIVERTEGKPGKAVIPVDKELTRPPLIINIMSKEDAEKASEKELLMKKSMLAHLSKEDLSIIIKNDCQNIV